MKIAASVEGFRNQINRLALKAHPKFHVVLGSGFGKALDSLSPESKNWQSKGRFGFNEVPGISPSTAPGHRGEYRVYENEKTGVSVVFQLGRLHGFEGHPARDAIRPAMVSRLSGIENFILTNAAGGMDPAHQPGDVMIIRDQVNMTGQNPLVGPIPTGPDGKDLGPRFPDLSVLYEAEWGTRLRSLFDKAGLKTHQGTYLGLLGPSFETPAEVRLFVQWGMHAVGMSTVWEAIALKHSGARLAGLSLISNIACGLGDGVPLDHENILEVSKASASTIVRCLLSWIETEGLPK